MKTSIEQFRIKQQHNQPSPKQHNSESSFIPPLNPTKSFPYSHIVKEYIHLLDSYIHIMHEKNPTLIQSQMKSWWQKFKGKYFLITLALIYLTWPWGLIVMIAIFILRINTLQQK